MKPLTFNATTLAAECRRAFSSRFWAVDTAHEPIIRALRRGILDDEFHQASIALVNATAEIEAARVTQTKPAGGAIAVVPLYNYLVMHQTRLEYYGFCTSIESTRSRLREAVADPSVAGILIDIDSPGGSTDGVEELANEIFAIGKKKNVIAVANSYAASAAYWIAVAANHLYCIPGSQVGSIGAFGAHEDISGALKQAGVAVTLVSAGKYKTEGNPYEPLSEEGKAYWQTQVDAFYSDFTRTVARGRHTTVEDVRNGMGQGRSVLADAAFKLNMCCGVKTWDEIVQEMQETAAASGGKSKAKALVETERARFEAWDFAQQNRG